MIEIIKGFLMIDSIINKGDNMKLKQDENGKTLIIEEITQTSEVPFGSDEIKRQIAQHSQVIQDLQLQLQAVQQFESNDLKDQEIAIPTKIDSPIINIAALESVSKIDVIEEIKGEEDGLEQAK